MTAAARRFSTDVVMTLGTKVAILLLNVAGTIVVARTLGPSGRGAIAVAFSFTLLLIQFGVLGLPSANAYFAARDPQRISRILTNTLWIVVGVGVLLILAGLAVREFLPATLRGLDSLEVAVVLVGLPAALANQLLQGILLAEGRMVAYNGVELAMAVATFAGLVVLLVGFSLGVLAAIVLMVAVNIAGCLTFFFILVRRHRLRLRGFDSELFQSMLRYASRLYLAALLAYLVWRVNLLLVNAYLGDASAGRLSIAIALAEAIHILPTVVALNLFPRVARGDPAGDTAAVFRSLTLLFGLLCALTVPLAGPLIQLLYGDEFSEAAVIYYWLVPGMFAYGMVSILSYHFAGEGFPMSAVLAWVPGVALDFLIVVPLLSHHRSAVSAAIGASAAYSLILLMHMRLFAKDAGGYAALVPRPGETVRLCRELLRTLTSAAPSAA